MSKQAVVVSAKAGSLTVLPVSKPECASCASACSRKQEPVSVTNPKAFSLHTGDVVVIEQCGRRQAVEGLVSLLFPYCSAVAGYFAAAPFAARLDGRAADGIRALFVLLGLVLSAALVILVTRHFPLRGTAEIVAVSGMTAGSAATLNAEAGR